MDYLALKQLHVGCVALSLSGFVFRGVLMLRGSPLAAARWLRVAPHVVDTVLLASGIALTFAIGQYPFRQGWLTAKLVGLVAYIVIGTVALRRGRSRRTRAIAFALALGVAAYIVSVAITHSAQGFLLLAGGT